VKTWTRRRVRHAWRRLFLLVAPMIEELVIAAAAIVWLLALGFAVLTWQPKRRD
jgi:ABC-type uncharacterized transport system involved in gliding motility auxiliary subunit